jgi:hypothetical protein
MVRLYQFVGFVLGLKILLADLFRINLYAPALVF